MEIPVDGISFVIRCKVFPLMGGVVSVWAFIGCEIHWAVSKLKQTSVLRHRLDLVTFDCIHVGMETTFAYSLRENVNDKQE